MQTQTDTAKKIWTYGEPDPERDAIIAALYAWIKQRPRLEFGNYGDTASYNKELRGITRQRHHALTMLRRIELSFSISSDDIKAGFRAFSGRLSWDGKRLDYCPGQYWPTEYRAATCAVLASIMWDYFRACMPEPTYTQHGSATNQPMQTVALYQLGPHKLNAGDWLHTHARREFGRGIASAWFR